MNLDFASLPVNHRANLDQVAFFYGLNPLQLHSLAFNYSTNNSGVELNQQSPKRARISPAYPMAPPNSAHGLARNDAEQLLEHGFEATGSGPGLNGPFPLESDGGSRLASTLVNSLRVVLCQNCLTRCDGQESMCSCSHILRYTAPMSPESCRHTITNLPF